MGRRARVPDEHIIRLNDLGLSLEQIGDMLGYHYTTVKSRLVKLGLASADTRHAFMAKIYKRLTEPQRAWLSDQLMMGQPIDVWLSHLIIEKYNTRHANKPLVGISQKQDRQVPKAPVEPS